MEPILFMKGATLGFFLCVPVGPIGLLCARRILIYGRLAGVVSLLGASTVDALYCTVAGFSISWVSAFLRQGQTWIQSLGAVILILVAVTIFTKDPQHESPLTPAKGLFGAFSSTFLMALANPMPIVVFTAALAAMGVQGWKGVYTSTAAWALGVFCGSALWSFILAGVVGRFRLKFNSRQLRIITKISGVIIFGFGVALAFTAFAAWRINSLN
ncbi:MAG: LysE family transporter [Desulfatiglandaceae bacterium]